MECLTAEDPARYFFPGSPLRTLRPLVRPIPTQTFCNRSFVHAGTSSGYVNNGGAGLCFVMKPQPF